MIELKAKFAAAQNAYDAAVIRDRQQNEGGQGFQTADAAFKAMMVIEAELFAAEWTAEVWAARKAAWNAAVMACGKQLTMQQVKGIESKLGYTTQQMQRAKALHG